MHAESQSVFNSRVRQLLLLLIIVSLAILLFKQLYLFFPGFLGAITLYIIYRDYYFNLTIKKKWNKTLTGLLFIFISIIIIGVPIYFAINMIGGKVMPLLEKPDVLIEDAKIVGQKIKEITGSDLLSVQNVEAIKNKITSFIPTILNNSASVLGNFAIMFFLLYFLLLGGRQLEKKLDSIIPLHEESVDMLSKETNNMIKANAIGIPVLAIIQGIVATIGYAIFGVKDYGLWGFLTGVFSLVPIVGTTIIWIPLCIYLYATNNHGHAIGLLIYAAILITNVDYIVRLSLMKKFMNVHPLITIFGVIVGVGLFGFWGVIFGPLLISYLLILIKIYTREFGLKEKEIIHNGDIM